MSRAGSDDGGWPARTPGAVTAAAYDRLTTAATSRMPESPGTFTDHLQLPEQPFSRQLASLPSISTRQPPLSEQLHVKVTPGPVPPAFLSITPLPRFTNV